MTMHVHTTVEVRGIVIALTDQAIEQIMALLPQCGGNRPYSEQEWMNMPREKLDCIIALQDGGIVNSSGVLTDFGKEVWDAIEAEWEHHAQQLEAGLEMDELDRLDARLRKRPKQRRYDG
jgi:hypothetical protein